MVDTIVGVQQGKLQGKTGTDYAGRVFYSFQGIPYAKPPLGELRFKVILLENCVIPHRPINADLRTHNRQNLGKVSEMRPKKAVLVINVTSLLVK